jgi:hypothetical protein
MSTQIKELIKQELEANVNQFLSKEINSFSMKYVNLDQVVNYLKSIGFVEHEELSTNGWQWDAWMGMKHPTFGVAKLSAEGYYGGVSVSIE